MQTSFNPQIIIDVRTKEEWKVAHVDGAQHFELANIQHGELPSVPKDTAIALYCRSGGRAGMALNILKQHGFINLYNFGGLTDMQALGYTIVQ